MIYYPRWSMYTKWTPNNNNGSQDTEKMRREREGGQRRVAGAVCISSGILEKDNKKGKGG